MQNIRLIPCLDIQDNKVVKGENFLQLKEVGDPLELAKRYNQQGADELVFLDITATNQKRDTLIALASKVAKEIFIPFTVGGGISSAFLAEAIIKAGADKVSINSSAVQNPQIINEISGQFGSQAVVLAVDVKRQGSDWLVFTNAGKKATGRNVLDWIAEATERGAGEILLTSMDKDGTKTGYDNLINRMVSERFSVPLIASGGCGELQHFLDGVREGKADAILAASVFHYGTFQIPQVKEFLQQNGVSVRY